MNAIMPNVTFISVKQIMFKCICNLCSASACQIFNATATWTAPMHKKPQTRIPRQYSTVVLANPSLSHLLDFSRASVFACAFSNWFWNTF